MKKENRILKNDNFSRIIKSGKRFHTNCLSCYFLKNNNHTFRIGISVSKKISKLAVVRNKLKRQVNASLTIHKFNFHVDLIIILKKEILNKTYNEIDQEIKQLIKFLSERISNEG